MRIQYYNQFFAGPDSPGPAQPRNWARNLADRGHIVDVIACDLNAYNEQTESAETYEPLAGTGKIIIHRLPVARGLRKNLRSRLRVYLGFAWAAYRYGRTLPVPDVVSASMQPLFVSYAALRVAQKKKKPFLLEVRDLWPDALVVKKAVSSLQAKPLYALARKLYAGADRIVSLTPGIKTELLKKGISGDLIDLFPNGFDEGAFSLASDARARTRDKYGWGADFVAVYTGAHIEVTAVDVIVKAASHLTECPNIRIDLFGSGQTKAGAIKLAESLGLKNIHFHDAVAKSEIPRILAGADAGIMTLFKSPLIHIYFENKFIDYSAAKLPILASMGGVQAELIERHGSGKVVDTFDDEGLARIIREAADDPEGCRKMGEAGYEFVTKTLNQKTILNHYAEALEALADGRIESVPVWDPFECLENRITTNGQQRTTNDERPTTNEERPTTNNERPTTNNERPTTNNERRMAMNEHPTTNDQ